MKKRFIFILIAILGLSGCASRSDLSYAQPEPIAEKTVIVKTDPIEPRIAVSQKEELPVTEELTEKQTKENEDDEQATYKDEIFFWMNLGIMQIIQQYIMTG